VPFRRGGRGEVEGGRGGGRGGTYFQHSSVLSLLPSCVCVVCVCVYALKMSRGTVWRVVCVCDE